VVAFNRARRPPAQFPGRDSATVFAMSESLQVTIVYEQGEEGCVVASIPEVPGAHSQGRTREEARANVIDALRGILELRFGERTDVTEGADSEPLKLVIGA
jgi:predicted RNase H-like HicB family nuclease